MVNPVIDDGSELASMEMIVLSGWALASRIVAAGPVAL
jgi:hypothetical protein